MKQFYCKLNDFICN